MQLQTTSFSKVALIILAGGKGTRMGSKKPKCLQTIAKKPIISWTLNTLGHLNLGYSLLVVGQSGEQIKKFLGSKYNYVLQKEPLGTSNAVLEGLSSLPEKFDTILVMNSDDSAFYKPETLSSLIQKHLKIKAKMTLLTSIQENSEVSGRVKRDQVGKVVGIIPKSQMTEWDYKNNHEIVCGTYIFNRRWLEGEIKKVQPDKKGEYNITALIKIAAKQSNLLDYILPNPKEWHSINTPKELRHARKVWKGLAK